MYVSKYKQAWYNTGVLEIPFQIFLHLFCIYVMKVKFVTFCIKLEPSMQMHIVSRLCYGYNEPVTCVSRLNASTGQLIHVMVYFFDTNIVGWVCNEAKHYSSFHSSVALVTLNWKCALTIKCKIEFKLGFG